MSSYFYTSDEEKQNDCFAAKRLLGSIVEESIRTSANSKDALERNQWTEDLASLTRVQVIVEGLENEVRMNVNRQMKAKVFKKIEKEIKSGKVHLDDREKANLRGLLE